MQSLIIVNTRVATMLLTKKWTDAHGLTMKEMASKYTLCTNCTTVLYFSMISMFLLLAPTLEVDVANAAIYLGDFYQGLVGYNPTQVKSLWVCTILLKLDGSK